MTVTGPGIEELKRTARSMKIGLQILEVPSAEGFAKAFAAASKSRVGAMMLLPDPTGMHFANMKQITELSVKHRIPVVAPSSRYANAGALMSYATDDLAVWRRTAMYVDKILKGTKPADLPVEQPTKFEFFVNLKTAKQIGLTIPPTVLARADKVIR
jgi:putative ABC transport system substrate-binding protein